MVLVTLEMNAQKEFQRCPDRGSAGDFVDAWISARRKSYPHAHVLVTYYYVERMEEKEYTGEESG